MENGSEKVFRKPLLLEGERCPNCKEHLTPGDLEMYPRCPYCDHLFPQGDQLEDFVLKPALSRWMAQMSQQFPR